MVKKNIFLILLLLLHLFLLVNLQFTAWPEMLSFPYLINNGFALYKDAVHVYPPLLVGALAFLNRIFGYDVSVLKIFAWGLFLINDVLIFKTVGKLTKNKTVSLSSVLVYTILQPILDGNMIWPDVVMTTPILFASLFLLKKKYFWTGIAVALAALVKQTGTLYLILFAVYMIIVKLDYKKYLLGVSAVFGIFLVWLILQNNFTEFLNWTVIYPATFWTKFPGYVQMELGKRDWLIIILLTTPIVFGLIRKRDLIRDKLFVFLIGLLIVGFIGVYPRFSFFHFQPGVAFLVILYGFLIGKYKKLIVAVVLVGVACFVLLPQNWGGKVRFNSQVDLDFARSVAEIFRKEDKVFLLGPQSGLYTLADRLPPKPWIDNFGWYFEVPGVQEELLDSWKKDPPKYIFVQNPESGNWYDLGVYQPKKVTEWIAKNYNKVEEVESGVWLWRRK